MREKQTDFWKLSEAVIFELKSLEYMESSLTNYRRLYARIGCFLEHRSIKEYSPAVGKAFIAEYYPCDTHRRRLVLLMIRRLDDHLNNIPYKCHRNMKTPDVPYVKEKQNIPSISEKIATPRILCATQQLRIC